MNTNQSDKAMKPRKKRITKFAKDILMGFSARPRTIPSSYFYDENGDRIFQEIMNMPEYYLSRCEMEIIERRKAEILDLFSPDRKPFNLVEFGAGDGQKTKILLRHFLEKGVKFTYYPVDISAHILDELQEDLRESMPQLKVNPLNMDYFDALIHLQVETDRRTIALFLGSNIGNFHAEEMNNFISEFHTLGQTGDLLFLGVDLRKDPDVILRAYSDRSGITARFNLNLLERMNRELGSDFDMSKWKHYAIYEPISGEARSYLISLEEQDVCFDAMEVCIRFLKDECIHTEISKKYSLAELEQLAMANGFSVLAAFTDNREYFVDTIWEVS